MSYSKYYVYKKQYTTDGVTWHDVVPLETAPSGDSIGTFDTLDECQHGKPEPTGCTSFIVDGGSWDDAPATGRSMCDSAFLWHDGTMVGKPDWVSVNLYHWDTDSSSKMCSDYNAYPCVANSLMRQAGIVNNDIHCDDVPTPTYNDMPDEVKGAISKTNQWAHALGTIEYVVAPNNTGEERECTISWIVDSVECPSRDFTIRQLAGSPTPTGCDCSDANISIAGVQVAAAGGDNVLIANFTADCEPNMTFERRTGHDFIRNFRKTYTASTRSGNVYATVGEWTSTGGGRGEEINVLVDGSQCTNFTVSQSPAQPAPYPPIEPIDMTGKLYVAKTVGGAVYGDYDCFNWSNTITPEGYSSCVGCAITGAYTARGIGDYVYIGTCSGFDPYALRGSTKNLKANIAIYFAGDNKEYSLSRGLFLYTHIREVLIGGNNVSFSIVPDTTGCESIFEGGSGDISEITRRLSIITPRCFFEGDFGNSIIFDKKVTIMKNAFRSLESNLTFNGGFTYENIGSYATDTWVFRDIYKNITITLNGNASDYPANIAANIRSVNPIVTVIDNTAP